LHRIFAERHQSTTEKVRAALQLGTEYFGVENGHLVHIDPAAGTHEIVQVRGSHPTIAAGATADLADTYCRLVVANGDTLLVGNVPEAGWGEDSAADLHELGCYLGAKVVVGSTLYGTLCFVDREPKAAFSEPGDRVFLERMAAEIGHELARDTSPVAAPEALRGQVRDATDTGGWEYDPDRGAVRGTQQLGQVLGTSERVVLDADEALQFFPSAVRGTIRRAARACLLHGAPFDLEVPFEGDEGSARWVRVRGEQLQDDRRGSYLVGTLEDITARKQAERALKDEQKALREMYRVAANRSVSFDDKVTTMLRIGREFLDLPYGFLTRIVDGEQRIVQAVGTHPMLQQGASCPLSEAYCRKTMEVENLLAVHNAVEEGWEGDPAYEKFELGTYIGSRVMVDGELYGTFCFAASGAREEPFAEQERTVVELMTLWTGYELSQRRNTRRLERQNERLDRFAGVVSHDLRNPLNVAKGRLSLVQAEGGMEADMRAHLGSVDDALDRMDEIIRDVLTLTRGGAQVEPEACSALVLSEAAGASWENVETAQATLRVEQDCVVRADASRLRQLFENLFRNAVEHGGDDVTVWVGRLADGFYVEDSGPGVAPDKREAVFEEGMTSSEQGTGLGLSIVRTIVAGHDAALELTDGRVGGARFEITGGTFQREQRAAVSSEEAAEGGGSSSHRAEGAG
jgi:PAS domain S-box-containing protein